MVLFIHNVKKIKNATHKNGVVDGLFTPKDSVTVIVTLMNGTFDLFDEQNGFHILFFSINVFHIIVRCEQTLKTTCNQFS